MKLFEKLEKGQFLVTIDSFVFKLFDGFQGIDDTEMLKRILELEDDEYKADNVDDAFMAGYHRNQDISWLKQHRDNIQVAPTIREYFFQKESLRERSESEDLPF